MEVGTGDTTNEGFPECSSKHPQTGKFAGLTRNWLLSPLQSDNWRTGRSLLRFCHTCCCNLNLYFWDELFFTLWPCHAHWTLTMTDLSAAFLLWNLAQEWATGREPLCRLGRSGFLFVCDEASLGEHTLFLFFSCSNVKNVIEQTFLSFIYQCTQSSDRQPFICCKLWNPYDSPAHAIMPGHLIKVHIPSKIKCPLCIGSPCLCQRFLGLSDTKYLIMYNSPSFSVSGIYKFLFLKVCDKLTWFKSVF